MGWPGIIILGTKVSKVFYVIGAQFGIYSTTQEYFFVLAFFLVVVVADIVVNNGESFDIVRMGSVRGGGNPFRCCSLCCCLLYAKNTGVHAAAKNLGFVSVFG